MSIVTGQALRFTKYGEYETDEGEIPKGATMIAYMPGLQRGWQKLGKNGKQTFHIMGLVKNGFKPPEREELGNKKKRKWDIVEGVPVDPWTVLHLLPMTSRDGQIFGFVTSTTQGRSAIAALCRDYGKRIRDCKNDLPKIELCTREYRHSDYGRVFMPVFKIVSWVPRIEQWREPNEHRQGSVS